MAGKGREYQNILLLDGIMITRSSVLTKYISFLAAVIMFLQVSAQTKDRIIDGMIPWSLIYFLELYLDKIDFGFWILCRMLSGIMCRVLSIQFVASYGIHVCFVDKYTVWSWLNIISCQCLHSQHWPILTRDIYGGEGGCYWGIKCAVAGVYQSLAQSDYIPVNGG